MAVGYHKLNTSAARSNRGRSIQEIPRDRIEITPVGAEFWDATFGNGRVLEEFVSECDMVRCRFDSGYEVTMRGGAVRIGIADKKNGIGQ